MEGFTLAPSMTTDLSRPKAAMRWIALFTFLCQGCTLARSVSIEAPTLAAARRLLRQEFPEAIKPTILPVAPSRAD